MASFLRLSTCGWEGWEWRYMLYMAFPVFWILLMSSKICNNTSNNGLNHYFSRKQLTLGKKKLKVRQKEMLLNDYIMKNIAGVIILIMWLMMKFLLKSKDVLYQVSSDLVEVNSLYSSFSNAGRKALPAF